MSFSRVSKIMWVAVLAAAGAAGQESAYGTIKLTSPSFRNGKPIPVKHSFLGGNISPTLTWASVPAGTKSLAVIVEDSTASNFSHWVIYNIPVTLDGLGEGMPNSTNLVGGMIQGKNDFGTIGWGGPWPPAGENHRYVFHVYALKAKLKSGIRTRAALLSAMKGKILGQGSLIGTFKGR